EQKHRCLDGNKRQCLIRQRRRSWDGGVLRGVFNGRLLRVCLRTLRILSRDKKVLAPLVTDGALLTLAKLAGLTTSDTSEEDEPEKEAMKVLCNVVYNSSIAQEKFIFTKLKQLGVKLTSEEHQCVQCVQIDPKHNRRVNILKRFVSRLQTGGVSLLTAALERCLEVQWKDQYEGSLDPAAPPISLDASQQIIEILKILFNITHSSHRKVPSEDDAALYRHLVAILRLCLMRKSVLTTDADDHTVNLLSALPLQCLDVLLMVPLEQNSEQCEGRRLNMDCVHALLMFMERRLESGDKIKEKLTPILNLLTESCRAHRETRHYIRKHILPPLRDVTHRPEEGCTVKSRLIRLMTHLDTDVKHCAAELIFVLCKENVRRFVKYTGYGNAAGLLATRGLLGGQGFRTSSPDAHYSSDSDSDTEEYRQVKDRINPVTGRVEAEMPDPMEGMSEEEKEEEAKRLIMLFNKLSRDNIIQPMGVNAEGKLVPMSGLRGNPLIEETLSESESDEDAGEGTNR
uniref:Synembryn n=1 Tax=Gouania willdenowi TaxID=441366 RepID=A0A8C5GY46_GOUWI